MPFLGTTPLQGFVSSVDKQSITNANGVLTDFTLTHPVANENDLEVFVGNVRQEPTAAYTATGTTLSMSEAPAASVNFYVIYKNKAQVTSTAKFSPELGANLDVVTHSIVSTSNRDINIAPDGTGALSFPNETKLEWPNHRGQNHTCTLDWQIPTNNRTVKLPNADGVLSHIALARTSGVNPSGIATVNITGLQTYPFAKYIIYFKISLVNASLRFRFLDNTDTAIFAAGSYQFSYVDNGGNIRGGGAEMEAGGSHGTNTYDGMVGRVEVLNVQGSQSVDEMPSPAILGAFVSRNGTTTNVVDFGGHLSGAGAGNNPNGVYGLQFKTSTNTSVIDRHDIEVYGVKTWTS